MISLVKGPESEGNEREILNYEEAYRPSNIDDYEYVMFGKIFRISEGKGSEMYPL